MAKPKLCLIPAAQGTSLYSVLPSSGVGDFDFTRSGSATRINAQGLIETVASGVSRLNYPMIDGVVKGCPSHILEPQRTNSFVQSNQFDTTWLKSSGVTITSEQTISPEGINNGWKFEKTADVYKSIGQNYTSSSETTFSIFAKKGTLSVITLLANINGGTNLYQRFDLENGVVSTGSGMSSSNIEEYGNGWYRCSSTFTNTDVQRLDYFVDFAENEAGFIYIYGGQAEVGSYPTSYIPTTTSAVTRSAETANGSGDASTFNDSEGVLMAEISALDDDVAISLSDNTFNNSISFGVYLDKISAVVRKDGGYITSGIIDTSTNPFNNNKIAIKYNSSSCDFYVNGFIIGSSNGVSYSSDVLDNLNFNRGSANDNFYGSTKQIQYYDSALTDIDLETLTSWVSFSDMAEGQLYSVE